MNSSEVWFELEKWFSPFKNWAKANGETCEKRVKVQSCSYKRKEKQTSTSYDNKTVMHRVNHIILPQEVIRILNFEF